MAIGAVKKGGGKDGHPMLSGILIGLVLGVGISAGVAVWVARMPNPFQNRALEGAPAAPAGLTPVAPPAAPAPTGAGSGASAGAPVAAAPASAPAAQTPGAGNAAGAAGPAPASGNVNDTSGSGAGTGASAQNAGKALESGSVTLQVGAFASEEDALRQVETIAQVSGARAKVLPPDRAEHPLFRVRIGPVQRGTELSDLTDALKANGISSTVVRAAGAAASPSPSP